MRVDLSHDADRGAPADDRAPESRAQALPATGSIYQAAYARPLFEDRRARNVGDTITINLVERNNAQKSANANATRNGSMTAGIGPISRLPR